MAGDSVYYDLVLLFVGEKELNGDFTLYTPADSVYDPYSYLAKESRVFDL